MARCLGWTDLNLSSEENILAANANDKKTRKRYFSAAIRMSPVMLPLFLAPNANTFPAFLWQHSNHTCCKYISIIVKLLFRGPYTHFQESFFSMSSLPTWDGLWIIYRHHFVATPKTLAAVLSLKAYVGSAFTGIMGMPLRREVRRWRQRW